MKVLVCGGRDYSNREKLYEVLDGIDKKRKINEIIEGGARGADQLARDWARKNGIGVTTYLARWDKYWYSAGVLRNSDMLKYGQPDLVVAFPGARGTADMIRRTKDAGLELIIIC